MSGKKGMRQHKTRPDQKRRNIWRSIRIIRRFTIADITRTVPGVPYGTVRKVVASLVRHGYIVKTGSYTGGRLGEYQTYLLKKETVEFPSVCFRCGHSTSLAHCTPKETDKEKTQTASNQIDSVISEVTHDPA
jgi:hypothetical protein